MIDFNDLPNLIAKQRKSLALTQVQLATKASVSRDLIASFESGRLADLSAKRLLRILHALDLDLRITTLNKGRPTLEDILAEEGREDE
jgi:transcriptional regulator with XRE-family HTH domain